MGFLKALGVTVCGLLLFLALSVFGLAFLLNSTILDRDFMNQQIDKLDISAIAHDTIEKQITDELPQNFDLLQGAVSTIISHLEPQIKDLLHNGINEGYDYFLNKDSKLSITIPLTEIKKSLKADIWQISIDYLKSTLSSMTDAEVNRYVENTAIQIPPGVLPAELAALPQNIRLTVIEQYLKSLGGKGVFNSASFGLNFPVETQVKTAVEQYFNQEINGIADSYTIDEKSVDTSTMQSIRDLRTVVGYFKSAYVGLIIFMIVMAGLIFLINWKNVKSSMRTLGVDLVIFGVIDLAGVLLARNLHFEKFITDSMNVSDAVQTWISGLTTDITGIMLVFSIGVLGAGVVLLTASFFIKKPEAAV